MVYETNFMQSTIEGVIQLSLHGFMAHLCSLEIYYNYVAINVKAYPRGGFDHKFHPQGTEFDYMVGQIPTISLPFLYLGSLSST